MVEVEKHEAHSLERIARADVGSNTVVPKNRVNVKKNLDATFKTLEGGCGWEMIHFLFWFVYSFLVKGRCGIRDALSESDSINPCTVSNAVKEMENATGPLIQFIETPL